MRDDYISIYFQKTNDLYLRNFHCPSCGRMAFRVVGFPASIVNNDGIPMADIPFDVAFFEYKCRGCNVIMRVYLK